MDAISDIAGGESAGASSAPPSEPPFSWDAGPMTYCSDASPPACRFAAEDRPDLPPEQRWGSLAQWAEVPCTGRASCGEAMFSVDRAGCVTLAADNIQSGFSECVLKYVEQFSWPCAAGQRVRDFVSCTIR